MATDKINRDINNEAALPSTPPKNQEDPDAVPAKENPDTESLQQKSERDRNQGNETIGIP